MPVRSPVFRPRWHKPEAQRRKEFDKQRGTSRQRGYDAAWEKVRAQHLALHPICCVPGCRTPRDRLNVDHIESVRENPAKRLDPSNLRTLCQSHHSARTSRDHSWNR
ncbi:HNH endonuclease signature motif containing protein [Acetobacter pasteurianus]|uniref:HNH endonuclease signature motif containing protein n=1 Tax=Acetobacter pasteurianus TaxID=438 RepID=UPI000B3E5BDF|nr:HNH endonuclease signature motif containing protein [Acetobacter pasteurianus]